MRISRWVVAWILALPLPGIAEEEIPDPEQGGRRNITLGAMFREEFAQQEGVKELKNGILYRVEETGAGKTPKLSDRVKVWYEGRRVDGQIFDQTAENGSREFRLNRDVISGWQEVLSLMREGDKWEVVIPPQFAYGAKGGPYGKIGSNETLVFKIKLIQVLEPREKVPAPQSP